METRSSLPQSQVPATCPYPEPEQSSPSPPPIPLSKDISSTKSHVPFPLLRSYQRISPGLRHIHPFCNKASFYGEEILAPQPSSKVGAPLVGYPRLLSIFAATFHIGGRSFNRNLRTPHAAVTGAHLSWAPLLPYRDIPGVWCQQLYDK